MKQTGQWWQQWCAWTSSSWASVQVNDDWTAATDDHHECNRTDTRANYFLAQRHQTAAERSDLVIFAIEI